VSQHTWLPPAICNFAQQSNAGCSPLPFEILLLQVAGVEGRHVMLLVTDSHIVDEAMLGDINGLLNTGEITGKRWAC
jgi:hypothetical protein